MIKCEYCGGSLSLENKFCPHCGRENKQAMQHAVQMEKYHDEFQETKEKVYLTSRKYAEVVVRLVILAVLLVAFVALILMMGNAYSWRRHMNRRKAEKNFVQYSEQIDTYLEQEDYLALAAFRQERNIPEYDSKYEGYTPIFRAAAAYEYFYYTLQNFTDGTVYDAARQVGYLGDAIDSLYNRLDTENYAYVKDVDTEKTQEVFDRISEYTEVLLMATFGFTREEAQGFKTMSSARRKIAIEERVIYEEE